MSNFDFLKDFDNDLYVIGNRIEKQVNVSPSAVKADATPFLERVLTILMEQMGVKFNPRKSFYSQLDSVYREGIISYRYKGSIYDAYMLRNRIHDTVDEIEKTEVPTAHQLHKKLFYIAKKLYRDFAPYYDSYKGVPQYKPIEIDTSIGEMDLVEIPDFSEIIDIRYDYCVICGEPNHSNYSLCCHKCNRIMDNANNFISIRNTFGKNATFTKEDLIEYGIPEGYANQLINSLVAEDMLRVRGRYITFNNMHLEQYLARIDKYIAICELITKFQEDKITPADIKQSREYKQGSFKQEPYYQFYKLVNREIVKKFEKYVMQTKDIILSIVESTITQKQLQRWYMMNLSNFKKGEASHSFILFNDLLMEMYIDMKCEGYTEKEIKSQLNITDEVYEFFCLLDEDFADEITQIKMDLISQALIEGKSKSEIIKSAGISAREYENLVKVARFNETELGQLHEREVESRKQKFIVYLEENDLATSCELAKFSLDDFYTYYDNANQSSEFYTKSTSLLMEKYLDERRKGKCKIEAIGAVGIKEEYVDRWLKRTMYRDFKDENTRVTVGLVLEGFKNDMSIEEIQWSADVDDTTIKRFIMLGSRGGEIYKPLYEYYEENILPQKLEKFLEANEHKSMRKALESAELSEEDVNMYYEMGKAGDERYMDFYETLLEGKKGTYIYYIEKGKSHNIAMRESQLTQDEYDDNKDELDKALRLIKFNIIIDVVRDNKTSNVAASKAKCSVDEIYDWYFRGRDGDEDYEYFYKLFHALYVRPNINTINEHIEFKNQSLENILSANKDQITKKDIEIWVKNGLLDNKVLKLDNEKDDDKKDSKSDYNANEMLREMGVKDYDRISIKKSQDPSTILTNKEDDVEELKKQILKK